MTEVADILEVLTPMAGHRGDPAVEAEAPLVPAEPAMPGDDARARIISLLGPVPTLIDDLVRLSGCTAAEVQIVLLELDLAGRLDRPGTGRVALK